MSETGVNQILQRFFPKPVLFSPITGVVFSPLPDPLCIRRPLEVFAVLRLTKGKQGYVFHEKKVLMNELKNPKLPIKGILIGRGISIFMGTIRALASAQSAQTENPTSLISCK